MPRHEAKFEWWSVEKLLTPEDGQIVSVVRDAWWRTNAEGDVLMWRNTDGSIAPQMNRDRRIVARVRHPEATSITQIPLAFYPIDVRGY